MLGEEAIFSIDFTKYTVYPVYLSLLLRQSKISKQTRNTRHRSKWLARFCSRKSQ